MDLLRSPDDRFASLPGYSFATHYVEVAGEIRVHYVDEGPADAAETVLLLHGEPSWSYLYRKMISPLADAGHRVIAPDLVGFGRSDKPASRDDYTYQRHVDWMWETVEAIGLDGVTFFGQDWGSLIGLRLVAEHPERFRRVVIGNGFLPTGDGKASDAFLAWRQFSQETPEFPVGRIVNGGCATDLPDDVIAAYDAPFPDETYKEGARQFPVLVPISPDDPASEPNRKAWESLAQFDKPFLTAFGDSDPITAGADRALQERIPGASGLAHTTIAGAGHFLQEDKGEELAQVILAFIEATKDA
ncbi:MAG: haloalkane dehalogenase [Actinobacteria bacterium]|nr:haloalkane dehalogenase [Actinomycetota bacterium]